MKKTKKKIENLLKKGWGLLIIVGVLLSSIGIPPFMEVLADANNTKLILQSNNNANTISIDGTDTQKLIYKIGETIVGSVKVKLGDNYLTPTLNEGKVEFALTQYDDEAYEVVAEVTSENGYDTQPSYFYQGSSSPFPGDKKIHLNITSNNIHMLDFCFEQSNGGGGSEDGPIAIYPIVAYFNGVENGVLMDEDGSILLPNNWTTGDVTFKAKVCTYNNETVPNDGFNLCDEDSEEEIAVRVEGIANANQINYTVTVSNDRSYIRIGTDFADYGKVAIHITSVEEGGDVNTMINVITEDLISISADAPIDMSYGLGSSAVHQAIITNDVTNDLSIFFGNAEATLTVSGNHVVGITAVDNNDYEVQINDDGSATLELPDLSVETTTTVEVTILLDDETEIKRTINIFRTAIILEYDNREGELRAGYVMNKGYLYNNEDHNDEIFDAYLQVILYKDDTVVGYKQIQIDDEDIINNLEDDDSWSIETYAEDPIILYEDDGTGVNGVSVFLTNGPISYESDTLPSIEYGIGAGLRVSWEAE